MSTLFGEIRQLAFIVDDIDAAMAYWSGTLGIGPFFIKRAISFDHFVYRGTPSPSPTVSIALANSGYIQIELIQQHDQNNSIYQDHQRSGQKGMQHVSSWLTTHELQAKRNELLKKGFEIAQECVIPASGVTLIYFSTEHGPGGLMFEIADLAEPGQMERVMGIHAACKQWDGQSHPVIEVSQ